MSAKNILWLTLYLCCMAAVVAGLRFGRARAISAYGTVAAQQEWTGWREDVRQLAPTQGVTKRRVPKSEKPPALVLMQDYFAECLIFSLVMSTALFLTTMIVVRGVLQRDVSSNS